MKNVSCDHFIVYERAVSEVSDTEVGSMLRLWMVTTVGECHQPPCLREHSSNDLDAKMAGKNHSRGRTLTYLERINASFINHYKIFKIHKYIYNVAQIRRTRIK